MEYLYLIIIAFLAGFTQGLSGFGSVMVSLPLVVLFLDVRAAVPLVSLLALCVTTTLTIQLRSHVRWRRIAPLLIAALPGMAMGGMLLKSVQARYLEILIGVILVTFSLYLFLAGPRQRELAPGWKYAAGFLSGILGGSTGANGPPVIIYTALQPWGKDPAKSTLVGYFVVAGVGISSIHAFLGLITPTVLRLFVVGFFPVMAGVLTGAYLYGRMDAAAYRKVITFLLLVMGVSMLVKAGMRVL